MEVVRFDKTWNISKNRKPVLKLPPVKTHLALDYMKLNNLCSIDGLGTEENGESTQQAHQKFMEQCQGMFLTPPKKSALEQKQSSELLATHGSSTSVTKPCTKSLMNSVYELDQALSPGAARGSHKNSHDIRMYTKKLRNLRTNSDIQLTKTTHYKQLRRLLRKLPFERKPEDNDQLFEILKTIEYLQDEVQLNVIKDLCMFVSLDVVKDSGFTVFGNQGLHMVLKGSVRPQTVPYLCTKTTEMDLRVPTPILEDCPIRINVGEFFGSLRKIDGRESNSKILSVSTCEPHCEFLKISTSDYARVVDLIMHKEQAEKMNLLLSCDNYKLWPRQPLLKLAEMIEWISYPPNTVLVSEGYSAPYIAILRSGQCHVLKHLDVIKTFRNHHRVKRMKQVVMGTLETFHSFGEISILCGEPMTCTIVSSTHVELGTIKPHKVKTLDETTTQLFIQSNQQTFGHLTLEAIEKEYISQERKLEWNLYKHTAMMEVINSRGIRPGYGKWSK